MKIKEELVNKLMKHTRKPEGPWGKAVGKTMGKIHAKVAEWGLKKANINPNDIILEIGFGGGYIIKKLAESVVKGKIYGIDYSEAMVDLAKEVNKDYIDQGRVELKHGNVSSLNFSKDTFDLIIGIETVNFWPDIINDLKEINRILKPGGTLLLINNTYKHKKFKKRNRKWKKLTNFNLYSPKKFKKYFINAGYSEIEICVIEEKNWIAIKGKKIYAN